MTPGSIRLGDGSRAACTACSRLYNVVTFHIKLVSTMLMAIYARVSTKDKGQDTQNQIRELREFAESSGWVIASEYIDHASGKSGDRDQLQAMMTDASKRKFKGVLVWALDRFTREGIEQTFAYVRQLNDDGVDFISYSEPHLRTTGPAGKLMLAVAAWIAEQERKRISDRTKVGMETARLKGKVLGRPAVKIDRARMLELHQAGNGVAKIAMALSAEGQKVSRETVRRVLMRA
jgi:DNA invertase Pin-like site-specific DNA recombinase